MADLSMRDLFRKHHPKIEPVVVDICNKMTQQNDYSYHISSKDFGESFIPGAPFNERDHQFLSQIMHAFLPDNFIYFYGLGPNGVIFNDSHFPPPKVLKCRSSCDN